MNRPKVAVLRSSPDKVLSDYEWLWQMAEGPRFLAPGKTTIIKDNISWHFPYPGANTTPWQLEGTILALKKSGYNDQVVVANETVVTNPFKGEKLNKYNPIFKKYGLPVKYNFRPEDIKWIKYVPKAKMLVLDKIFPEGIYIPEYFFDKNIVHLPTVKTHIYTTTTGAMKNAFGGLLTRKRHYTHSDIHKTLVDLLNIQKEIHSGIFAFMDGTTAGCGPGPRTMKPVITDYILASGDCVAIDAVAAKMMGFDPMKLDYIRLAHEAGLGCGDTREIEVVGEDISKVNLNFYVGDNLASRGGDLFWFGPLKAIQKLFFHTPLVYLFIYASFIYHDFFWYPLKGRRVVDKWQRETAWGRLFKQYPSD